jgi:hypothetical protein
MTEYSRTKLYEHLDALRTTLEEAVDAGDIYETPARALCAQLWEIEEHAKLKERLTAAYHKPRNRWKGNR